MTDFEDVRKLWKQRPFKPFRIITDSGQHYDVLAPEHVMVLKSTLVVGVRKKPNDREFDSTRHLGVLNVNAIEVLDTLTEKA